MHKDVQDLGTSAFHKPTAIDDVELSLFRILDLLQKWRGLFVASVLISILFAVGLLAALPAQYTATAVMLIDANIPRQLEMQPRPDLGNDASYINTQVEVLKSETVALAVIDKLKMSDDDRYLAPIGIGAIITRMTLPFAVDEPRSEFHKQRSNVTSFLSRLDVRRVMQTYAFEIQFTSTDPELAAAVANAVVDVYVTDQLNAKFKATQRASLWLSDRLAELGKQAGEAERAVVEFKNSNNIVEAGRGQLMNEQQLGEINTQLVSARAATAEAKAKLDRIDEILAIPDLTAANSAVTDALGNSVIVKLRNQYAELASREADWTVRLGSSHSSVVNIRNDMHEIKKSIRDELQRIGQSYRSDYEIAKSRQRSIEDSLASAVSQSQVTSKAQVELRELESAAQSYRALYDNFLQRQLVATQQQSFPVTEARAVTVASPPVKRSNPAPARVLTLALFLGCVLGGTLIGLREFGSRTLRTPFDVVATAGVPCIATVPRLTTATLPLGSARTTNPFMRECIHEPRGHFAESIREIQIAIGMHPGATQRRVIGVVSSISGEGKTTITSNLAEQMASAGASVILIDCDLRRATLSKSLDQSASKPGLHQVLAQHCSLEDAVLRRNDTSLFILPAIATESDRTTSDVLVSAAMQNLLGTLKSQFDFVVLDLPPLLPLIDARAIAHHVDGLIYVAKWGSTRKAVVKAGLTVSAAVETRVLGIVLNQADMRLAGPYGYYDHYQPSSQYYRAAEA